MVDCLASVAARRVASNAWSAKPQHAEYKPPILRGDDPRLLAMALDTGAER